MRDIVRSSSAFSFSVRSSLISRIMLRWQRAWKASTYRPAFVSATATARPSSSRRRFSQ